MGRHGDLTQLYSADGTLQGSAVYDPFGKPTAAGSGSRLGFQADWTDPANGQVWMGARWYDPANAQFTSRDTVMGELMTPVALNRYTYAHNNPLKFFDPDGRRPAAETNGNDTPRDTAAAIEIHTGGHNPVQAAQQVDAQQQNQPRPPSPTQPQPQPSGGNAGPRPRPASQSQPATSFFTGLAKGAWSVVWGVVYELPKGLYQTAKAELDAALRIQREQGLGAAFVHVVERSRELPAEMALAAVTGLVETAKEAWSLNPVTLYNEGRRAMREGRFDEWLEETGQTIGELAAEAAITLATAGAGGAAATGRASLRNLGRKLDAPTPAVAPQAAGLADDALVVRGGQNLPGNIASGSGVSLDAAGAAHGVSVQAGTEPLETLVRGHVPHGQIGVTPAGDPCGRGRDHARPASGESLPLPR